MDSWGVKNVWSFDWGGGFISIYVCQNSLFYDENGWLYVNYASTSILIRKISMLFYCHNLAAKSCAPYSLSHFHWLPWSPLHTHSLAKILSDPHLANSKGQFSLHLTWPLSKIWCSLSASSSLKHFLPYVYWLLPLLVLCYRRLLLFALLCWFSSLAGPKCWDLWVLLETLSSFASHLGLSFTHVTTTFITPPTPLFWGLDPYVHFLHGVPFWRTQCSWLNSQLPTRPALPSKQQQIHSLSC